jgi:serpin B
MDQGLKVLEMPYEGKDLSMVVLLPDTHEGIEELAANVSAETFAAWTSKMDERDDVQVTLPKFKVEAEFDLGATLQAMGMGEAFTPGSADLSGMDGSRSLFISKILHKAVIEVNEEGSEAAAATGVGFGVESVSIGTEVNADHPFMYFIRDNASGSVLFLGRMMDPTSTK